MNLNKRQRLLVVGYSVFHCLWGWFVLRSVDVFVWGVVLAVFNILSAVWSICSDWPLRFRAENETVYKKLFKPLKVSRRQFKRVLDCKRNIKILHAGDHYAIEKCTRVDSLALLISGRLLVSQNSKPLHVIGTLQFVDSPEYFGVSTDELFQVTITALEDTKLIVWHRDKLRLTIMNDEFLRIIFDHVIGRDVVRKLIQVSDTVTTVNGTAHLFSKDSFEEHYINENEPMLERKIGS
ncbi:unnamed protein product [Allacma fusca]|uniref:POPDC1-3 domain-containing protein n=1 Tax=Allacma fusca TaxID=39272 RepID=A0A8J2P9M1_9HEXA|nr:unnamed protein product [Allacma fusca]